MSTATSPTSLDIARASYRSISLYAPNRAPARIDLSDNTNLWGVPPAAARAIAESSSDCVTRYPSLYAPDLKSALAKYAGVDPGMVVTGCGSDDILDSAIRAFGEPGASIAYPDPSFAMIPIFAKMNGLNGIAIPLTDTHDADTDAFLAANAEITYLCTPNNPTGESFSRERIEAIVERARGLVIIDEAYCEFAGASYADLVRRFAHVLVTRTMSKAFGLAGLRIGYAMGAPALVAEVEKSRGPYKVSGIAERAAVAALADVAWVEARVAEAVENRERFIRSLAGIGLAPIPSAANFVLVPVSDAQRADRELRARGIAVRPFTALPRIGDALRISIGPWEMLQECIDALEEIGDLAQ